MPRDLHATGGAPEHRKEAEVRTHSVLLRLSNVERFDQRRTRSDTGGSGDTTCESGRLDGSGD